MARSLMSAHTAFDSPNEIPVSTQISYNTQSENRKAELNCVKQKTEKTREFHVKNTQTEFEQKGMWWLVGAVMNVTVVFKQHRANKVLFTLRYRKPKVQRW